MLNQRKNATCSGPERPISKIRKPCSVPDLSVGFKRAKETMVPDFSLKRMVSGIYVVSSHAASATKMR